MADFLTRLAGRVLGINPTVQPIIAPMYAHGSDLVGNRPDFTVINDETTSEVADGQGWISPSPARSMIQGLRGQASIRAEETRQLEEVSSIDVLDSLHQQTPPSRVPQAKLPAIIPLYQEPRPQTTGVQPSTGYDTYLRETSITSRDESSPVQHSTHHTENSTVQIIGSNLAVPMEQKQGSDQRSSHRRDVQGTAEVQESFIESPSQKPGLVRSAGSSSLPGSTHLSQAEIKTTTAPAHKAVEPGITSLHLPTYQERERGATAHRHEGTPAEAKASSPTPTIQVTIGRIEVRATPPSTPRPQPQRSGPPVMSLDDYLNQRAKGGH